MIHPFRRCEGCRGALELLRVEHLERVQTFVYGCLECGQINRYSYHRLRFDDVRERCSLARTRAAGRS